MSIPYFEQLLGDKNNVNAFRRRQKSAVTITLMGPTSSAKSTLITDLLPPESNKLLSHNIGDTAQTTLIPTRLMLNSRFSDTEIMIGCVNKFGKALYPDFLENMKTVLTNLVYENRDDIEDMESYQIDFDTLKKILDPTNRAYHVYRFVVDNKLDVSLLVILEDIYKRVSILPRSIKEDAEALFREQKRSKPSMKKIEAYEQLVDKRMGTCSLLMERMSDWFDILENKIKKSLDGLWSFSNGKDAYILLADLQSLDAWKARELTSKLYSPESPYSLVYDEVIYATRPSESFIKVFSETHPERTVKINVIDTIGLTQSSQQKDDISLNMDAILDLESDALLFLCAADEQPLVYETCIELLQEKKKSLEDRIVVVCRTKADIVIRNIMRNAWKRDNGTNMIEENQYGKYAVDALRTFVNEYIFAAEHGEKELGYEEESAIEYISLTPDSSADLNKYINNELAPVKLFEILFSIVGRVENMHGQEERMWLQSNTVQDYPLNVDFSGEKLTNTIALALVTKDRQNGNQYKDYINKDKAVYHGRSVNCFRKKLSYGEGHETSASVYDNFRLYITNMVARWLREVIPRHDLVNNFSISFEHLYTQMNSNDKVSLSKQFANNLTDNWNKILHECAKSLSYKSFRREFEHCYYRGYSWSDSFRESLKVISQKYSDESFWLTELKQLFFDHANDILQKLYVFD